MQDEVGDRSAEITRCLAELGDGDESAVARLVEMVYAELRAMADDLMARERPGHTYRPTDLVHEAFLRLFPGDLPSFENRAHFFVAAARAMRRILVDRARRRRQKKRGGGAPQGSLRDSAVLDLPPDDDLLALDDALARLQELDRRMHDIVMLRYFAGMTITECARTLGVSVATVNREWAYARAWLRERMGAPETREGEP